MAEARPINLDLAINRARAASLFERLWAALSAENQPRLPGPLPGPQPPGPLPGPPLPGPDPASLPQEAGGN